MAKIQLIIVFLVSVLLVSSWVPTSLCAKKPVSVAKKEDVPYIRCQVCEKLATNLYRQVKMKEAQIAPKKITEFQIIEIAENVCDLNKEEANWIKRIDIVEKGDRLKLVEQDTEGQCNSECKTIERACDGHFGLHAFVDFTEYCIYLDSKSFKLDVYLDSFQVMGYSDTDVAEYLFKKPRIESLVNYLCKNLTKACSSKPPPVPKDRTPGEPFVPKSSKEAEMERMLRSMEGMPGASRRKMYSEDDLWTMQNYENEDADEDFDEYED
ncbi:hypothetical protein HHK36_026401 [Tetracentron sinense]|uniref:DUF3456 domain-containing protein n=1 Tax=Tetracentron sinense TaxID=13715 RepID=A0A834YIP4_TETSI|nr:hypothetical protein HHK36_026401 [Tetracentron sinense]